MIYAIALFAAGCYTLSKERYGMGGILLLFTIVSTLFLIGGAIFYALALSDAITTHQMLVFNNHLMPVQFLCAGVALLHAIIVEFCSPVHRHPRDYSYLTLT